MPVLTSGWKLNRPPENRLSSLNVRTEFSTPSTSTGFASSGPAPAPSSAGGREPRARVRARAAGSARGGQLPDSSTFSRAPLDA